jgi:NADH-quinone oxidoreductase subunit A
VGQYLPILALLVLAVLFAVLSFVASRLLAPHRATRPKLAPYESGIVPGREPPQRFPVRFYLIAMIFIVFDIEIIFLYPWTVSQRALGVFGLIAIAIFAASVFESFLYLLSKGGLEWGPVRKVERPAAMVSAQRTAGSTVRRVGTEGRYSAAEQAVLASVGAGEPMTSEVSAPGSSAAGHGGHHGHDGHDRPGGATVRLEDGSGGHDGHEGDGPSLAAPVAGDAPGDVPGTTPSSAGVE